MVAAGVGALGCLRCLVRVAGEQHVRTARDLLGNTALHHAALAGQLSTLGFLLRCIHPEAELPTNAEGASVLQMAAASGELDCVLILLQRKTVGDALTVTQTADRTGFTPLHAAAFRGHSYVCEALLAAGADASAECRAHAEGNSDWSKRRVSCATPASLAESAGHHTLAKQLHLRALGANR